MEGLALDKGFFEDSLFLFYLFLDFLYYKDETPQKLLIAIPQKIKPEKERRGTGHATVTFTDSQLQRRFFGAEKVGH
jgi:hypothetical protein